MSSLVWTAIGVAIVVASLQQKVGTWHQPGSGFVPLLTGVLLAGLGLGVFVQETAERRRTGAGLVTLRPGGNLRVMAVALGSLLAYALLLDRVGYTTVTFAFMLFAFRGLGGVRWAPAVTLALVAAVGSFVLFGTWLRVPLPLGPGGF